MRARDLDRSGPVVTRRDRILEGMRLERAVGAEIGPLDRPLIGRADGSVYYVDHCDTATLRGRWSTDPAVDVSKLQVDAVWGQRTLREALEEAHAFDLRPDGLDYVVASHVIEHVPDLVSWLHEVWAAVSPSGAVRLAVPDRRFTFDFLRRTSSLTDVLDAFVAKRRTPGSSRVLDFALHLADVDCGAAWRGEVTVHNTRPKYSLAAALSLAEDALRNGTYHDVHCWVFTPSSFAELMLALCERDCLAFACEWLKPTEPDTFEFFVSLRPESDATVAARSWQQASEALRDAPASAFVAPRVPQQRAAVPPQAARQVQAATSLAEFRAMWDNMQADGYFARSHNYPDFADPLHPPDDRPIDTVLRGLDYTAAQLHFPLPFSSELERAVVHTEASWLPQLAELPTRGLAVDIGCGYGRSVAWLKDRFDRVIGIDVSEHIVRQASATFRGCANTEFLLASGDALPDAIADGSADFIYAFTVFQHVPREHTAATLRSAARKLKPGARLVFNLVSGVNEQVNAGPYGIEWTIGYSQQQAIELIERCGLRLDKLVRWTADGAPASWLWLSASRG